MGNVSVRTRKVASLLQKEIADIIRNDLRDPRLQKFLMVTVSGIDLAPDHRNATVFVSFMAQEKSEGDRKAALTALGTASGFIKKSLVKRMDIKVIPSLLFRYDTSFDYADKMSGILKSIK